MENELDELKCRLFDALHEKSRNGTITDNEVDVFYHLTFEPAVQERIRVALEKPKDKAQRAAANNFIKPKR